MEEIQSSWLYHNPLEKEDMVCFWEEEDIVLSTATGVPGVLRQRRLGAGTKDLSEEG